MKQGLQRAASHLNTLAGPETPPDGQLHGVSRLGAVTLCFHLFLLHRKFLACMAQNRNRMGLKKKPHLQVEKHIYTSSGVSLWSQNYQENLLHHRVGILHAQGGE
jgi:hypothetical protein